MTERQESSPAEIPEEGLEATEVVEEAPAPTPAPSAAAQRAAEALASVKESREAGLSTVLDTIQSEALTLKSLSPTGSLDFELVEQFAAVIPVEVLYQVEDVRPGSLLELFADKTGDNNYSFNFEDKQGRFNTEAEAVIGLNYFFKNKPEVRRLRATSADGKVEIGDRGDALKGSFYDGEEYVEVMAGYDIQILETIKPAGPKMRRMERKREKAMAVYETVQADPDRFSAFTDMLDNGKYDAVDTSNILGETQEDRLTRKIIERSADAGIDPYLVMSLLKAENGDNGKHFGVLMDNTNNFEAQLDWALKVIGMRERGFTGKLYRKGHYSEEFLAYFSESYSPSADNEYHFKNLYTNYALYAGFTPMTPEELAPMREEARKIAPKRQIEADPDNGKYTIETVIPDEAYRAQVQAHLSSLSGGERVAEAARILAQKSHPLYKKGKWNTGKHCWDWVNKAYTVAGYHWYQRGQREGHYHYKHKDKELGEYARRDQLQDLQPGDWLYLHVAAINKKWGGDAGDHSVIFLRWKNKEKLIAEFADAPKAGKPAKITTRRLADDRVGKSHGKNYHPVIKRTSPGEVSSY